MLLKQLEQRQTKIEDMLSAVHASVKFVPESNERAAYLAAKSAVSAASNRILVVGDYSPPINSRLDQQAKREEYLSFIEQTIVKNAHPKHKNRVGGSKFCYRRIIQRPPELYDYLSENSTRGDIKLKREYMQGDEQMFEHIQELLKLYSSDDTVHQNLHLEILITPFLPNCPSILVVDDSKIQFTIPHRGADPLTFGKQKLFGVLRMEDYKKGNELTEQFAELIDNLKLHSLNVTGISETADENISSSTGLPIQ